MKKMKSLILCIAVLITTFSTIAYAETTTMEYGDYTYDDSGNVTIGGYYITKDTVDEFLSYVGETYSVTSIK